MCIYIKMETGGLDISFETARASRSLERVGSSLYYIDGEIEMTWFYLSKSRLK